MKIKYTIKKSEKYLLTAENIRGKYFKCKTIKDRNKLLKIIYRVDSTLVKIFQPSKNPSLYIGICKDGEVCLDRHNCCEYTEFYNGQVTYVQEIRI